MIDHHQRLRELARSPRFNKHDRQTLEWAVARIAEKAVDQMKIGKRPDGGGLPKVHVLGVVTEDSDGMVYVRPVGFTPSETEAKAWRNKYPSRVSYRVGRMI